MTAKAIKSWSSAPCSRKPNPSTKAKGQTEVGGSGCSHCGNLKHAREN